MHFAADIVIRLQSLSFAILSFSFRHLTINSTFIVCFTQQFPDIYIYYPYNIFPIFHVLMNGYCCTFCGTDLFLGV